MCRVCRRQHGVSELAPLDPERLFTTLADHGVRYILIGAMAARLHGFPRMTADADITPAPDRENLRRLATALRALDAKVFTESVPEGLPFDSTPEMLGRAEIWNLATAAGRLDIVYGLPESLMARESAPREAGRSGRSRCVSYLAPRWPDNVGLPRR